MVSRDHREVDPKRYPPQRQGTRPLHHALVGTWNENPRPDVWHITADEILESLSGYL